MRRRQERRPTPEQGGRHHDAQQVEHHEVRQRELAAPEHADAGRGGRERDGRRVTTPVKRVASVLRRQPAWPLKRRFPCA